MAKYFCLILTLFLLTIGLSLNTKAKVTTSPGIYNYDEQNLNQVGYDIYQINHTSGDNLEFQISFQIAPLDIAILDTNFDYSVIWGIISKFDPVHNPHLLADTYSESGMNDTSKVLSYQSTQLSLYLLIYSLDRMAEDAPLNVMYDLTTSHTVNRVELDDDFEAHLPYGVQGTIEEDADDRWDRKESYFVSITLRQGEILDLLLATEDDNVFAMVFNGDDEKDIDTSVQQLFDNFDRGQGYPSNVYMFVQTFQGVGYGSYIASNTISANIAVFSYSDYAFTSDFVVRTSIPTAYDEEEGNNTVNESGSDSSLVPVIIFVVIIIGGFLLYRYYKNSQTKKEYNRYNYQRRIQFGHGPSRYQETIRTKPPNAQNIIFCYNCGTKNTGKFCTNCGSDLQE